jgi:hypothetical protein
VGTVVDPQGAAVQDAEITATSKDTGTKYTTHTGSNGGYIFSSLNFGTYRIDANKTGFKVGSIDNVKLDASTQLSASPIALQIGAQTETVTVEAGAGEQVQTTSASVTNVIDTQQLEDLPILDRSPLGMIQMEPGVVFNGKTDTVIDGQRSSFTSLTLDGINIQDNFIRENDTDFSPNNLFLSQTSEFTINTQNGDPSVGGGSSAISIVTPRGTNSWHGEGFWFYRSNKWAANDWFNDASGVPQVGLNQNQGGGNIGGPLLKKKLFIYAYYEFKSLGATTPIDSTILTPGAATGTFQYHTSCDNTAGNMCPAGVSPGQLETVNLLTLENSARGGTSPIFTIDPAVASLISVLPTAGNNTRVGDTLNTTGFAFNSRANDKLRNPGVRVDYAANEHNNFSGTYQWNQQILDRPDIDATFDTVPIVSNNEATNFASLAWRWSPGQAKLTNEVRFGFDFAPAIFASTQQFGATYITGTAFTNPLPNFFDQGRDTKTYSYQDNGAYQLGNHSLIFGFQLQRVTTDPYNFQSTSEDLGLGFSQANSDALLNSDFPAPLNGDVLANANALLSTLGGFVSSVNQTFNVTSPTSGFVPGADNVRNYNQNDWSLYAGDSWRIRRNLTINYGLRWEYLSPLNEKNGLMLLPTIPGGSTATETLLSDAAVNFVGGSGPLPYKKDLKDFAPNFGIAWDPFGDGKTAIRAGYSMHYVNDDLITAVTNALAGNAGLASTNGDQNVVATISGVNGLSSAPGVAAPPFGIPTTFQTNYNNLGGPANNAGFEISPNLRTPYVQDWNLSFQRDIGWNTTVTVSYLGNHGTALIRGIDVNQVLINQNGFLSSFNVARGNCFASIAAGQGCNPAFTGPGSQSLAGTIFPALPGGGFLDNGTVQAEIESGQVGDLADVYHINGIESVAGQFTPNEFIRGGDLLENFSSSNYNAGEVQVRRRFSNGLILQASYVWSKAIDDADGSQTNFQPLLDNGTPQIERSRASYDVPNAFKANFNYELPFGKGHAWAPNSNLLNKIVSGWNVSSIFTWQSGSPFSIFSERGTVNRDSRSGQETVSTSLTGAQIKSAIGTSFPSSGPFAGEVLLINPSFIDPGTGLGAGPDGLTCSPLVANGFCNPQPGQLGNLARNAFDGPAFFDMDFSLYKRIPIHEAMSLELRGEAFNLLNHPVFFFGDQNINSTTFGQSTSTISTPRIVQIGATFRF